MARISVPEGIMLVNLFKGLFVRKKRVVGALNSVAGVLLGYAVVRELKPRLHAAALNGEGLTMSPEEVAQLSEVFKQLDTILNEV